LRRRHGRQVALELAVPRDRAGTFEPVLVPKPCGPRDTLGIWMEQTEGAKFWLKVFNDLKTRAPTSSSP
jgi:transposase-like protein